ncbi:MAG: hypothetical protein ACXVHQ_15205 [Solirubrobacteraceae bacterium]
MWKNRAERSASELFKAQLVLPLERQQHWNLTAPSKEVRQPYQHHGFAGSRIGDDDLRVTFMVERTR